MSIIYMIITIVAMVVVQFIIGSLWYSKFLFGKLFMSLSRIDFANVNTKSIRISYMKALITSIFKAIIIYLIAGGISMLLDSLSFNFILLIAIFVILEMLNEHIWGGKSFKLYLLNAFQSFVTIIACFLVAFFFYSILSPINLFFYL